MTAGILFIPQKTRGHRSGLQSGEARGHRSGLQSGEARGHRPRLQSGEAYGHRPRPQGGFLRVLLATFLLLMPWTLGAQEVPIPEPPTRWVTDTVGFMPPAAVGDLDRRLEAYQQQTGHELLVYIGRTTRGVPIEDFAVRAFERWKVGRKGIDDG